MLEARGIQNDAWSLHERLLPSSHAANRVIFYSKLHCWPIKALENTSMLSCGFLAYSLLTPAQPIVSKFNVGHNVFRWVFPMDKE